MPAFVMDSDSYLRETGELDTAPGPTTSSLGLSRVISAPDPVRPGFLRSPEALKSQSALRRSHTRGQIDEASTHWYGAASAHLDTLLERPEKRPKLDHKLDTSFGKSFKRGNPVDTSSPVSASKSSHVTSAVSTRSSDVSEHEHPSKSPCFKCWGTEDMVSGIVKGLMDLQVEVSRTYTNRVPYKIHEAAPDDVTKHGLKHSLEWTISGIRATVQRVRASSATRPGLPSLTDAVPERNLAEMRRPSLSGPIFPLATSAHESRSLSLLTDSTRPDEHKPSDPTKDPYYPVHDSIITALTPENIQRSQVTEPSPQEPSTTVYPPGMAGTGPQSPMQHQHPHRTLPSPPSAQYPSPGFPGQSPFSPANVQAAQASHLQDLQHQISTKTLALQTLQREHDQLLAAFSRSQIRCSTLDKKSQVSDHEINSLTEEKVRLQQQVESLEAQVEDFTRARDESHKQSSADGAQWRQIMAMSSQLQIKGAEETRRYRADREAWEADRTALQLRIQDLEIGTDAGSKTAPPGLANDGVGDPLNATSVEILRKEIIRLRRLCADMEKTLQDMSGETEEIDNAITAMANIRQRIANRRGQDENS